MNQQQIQALLRVTSDDVYVLLRKQPYNMEILEGYNTIVHNVGVDIKSAWKNLIDLFDAHRQVGIQCFTIEIDEDLACPSM